MSLRVFVRSKRDADAVRAMVERFYPDWGLRVETLGGARRADDMIERLRSAGALESFTVVLLGREDEGEAARLAEEASYTVSVHVVPRRRVRNARLEMLAAELAKARSRYRLPWWDDERQAYMVAPRPSGALLEGARPEPSYEPFLITGEPGTRALARLLGAEIHGAPLLLRGHGSTHYVYLGGQRYAAVLEFPDEGVRPVVVESRLPRGATAKAPGLDRLVEANREVLRAYERASISYLRGLGEFDTVIVPWSGGKDSTAALLLALRAFGAKRLYAVFTDTGTEFPETLDYIERTSRLLGVRVYRAYAGVDKELLRGAPLPRHDNRWCTGLKIAATEKAIEELAEGRTLIVLGDRDAESPGRARRPPTRSGGGERLVAAPLRLWSAAHVQLYLEASGVPPNPLYEKGFYRVGCYMCPALRSWENYLILTTTPLYTRLLKSRIFRQYAWRKLYKRNSGENNTQ